VTDQLERPSATSAVVLRQGEAQDVGKV